MLTIQARLSVVFDALLCLDKLRESWYKTLEARPIMQARVRRSRTAPSGLDYHVLTPQGLLKYLDSQRTAPDHLKDFYCLDESHRSITDYCAGFGVGPSAPSHSYRTFVSDFADKDDEQRCMAFNGVKTLEEILDSDRPVMTVQVTRFSDATMISLSLSHVIGDLATLKSFFKGWESTLQGTPPPPFEQLGKDPFEAYGPGGELAGKGVHSNNPPLPPGWRVYGILDKLRLVSRILWDSRITRPENTISQKCIFISDAEIKGLVEQAQKDLVALEAKRKKKGIESKRPLTVTKSNVLYAWLLKNNHTHLSPNAWSKPVTIVSTRVRPPTGMKPQDEGDDFPKSDMYGAAMLTGLPSLRVGKLRSMPLGELALHIKDGIREASTPEYVRRFLAFTLHNALWKAPTGKLALFMPPNENWSGVTDWRLVKFHEIDMTPARVDGTGQQVQVCGFNTHMVTADSQRDRWACLGEAGGGVWFMGVAGEEQWKHPDGFGKYPFVQRRASKL